MIDFLRNLTKSAEEKQQERLTAYLDNALPPHQRQQFEQELAQNAQLQAQVEQERRLKEQLRGLARRRVPRNFTLDAAKYGRSQPQRLVQLYPALRLATALNALFLIAVLVLGLFNSSAAPTFNVSQEQAAAPVAMDELAEFDAQSETAIMVTTVTEIVAAEEEGAANDATEPEPELAEEMPVEEAADAEEAAGEPPAETNGSFATTAVPEPTQSPTLAASAGETADLPLAAATSLPATPTPLATATSSSLPHNLPTATVEQRSATEIPTMVADGAVANAPVSTVQPQIPFSPPRTFNWLPVLLTVTFVILLGLTVIARRRL